MTDHEFKVGEKAFVTTHFGRPTRRVTVTEVRSFKRGTRVTCSDGSQWDMSCEGRQWGARRRGFYTGPRLVPHTKEMATEFRRLIWGNRVQWAAENFTKLTPEQQEELGKLATEIKKEHPKS